MYLPEQMKLNKHQLVKIPENKDYFARLGKQQLGDGSYTGDQVAALPGSKMDEIIAGEFAVERELREKAEAEAAEKAAAAAAKTEKKVDSKAE